MVRSSIASMTEPSIGQLGKHEPTLPPTDVNKGLSPVQLRSSPIEELCLEHQSDELRDLRALLVLVGGGPPLYRGSAEAPEEDEQGQRWKEDLYDEEAVEPPAQQAVAHLKVPFQHQH
eukprot:CAMPEP_0195017894 /NCGR_PEP_ID=MMETSP0326_2-20130528/28803_1 /TAXON_ID=2866 ORGANISM="Crypthecodinium cohnii, Strain Seligo" /NCGR_SAMPLE_ID=MMETSP0326_2 /ASSEMBLY_ACC=CAM_ASM_000348 /LENGTH=117 /DNA_ID=CAMNT_0040034919 /DNA_START=422 /DNA_END=774 /DNA_ORIENTATION=-